MITRRLAPVLAWLIRNWPIRRFKGRLLHSYLIPSLNVPRDGEFVAAIENGARLRLRYADSVGETVAAIGTYEPGELKFLCRSLHDGDTAMDVGANVGVFTVVMAKAVGPNGAVIAIEPDPHNIARLRANVQLNGLDNVSLVECAAGAACGTVTLSSTTDHAFTRTIDTSSTSRDPARPDDGVAIPVKTLDDVWGEHGHPRISVLKIDIEGAEVSAIQGALGMLRACRPAIVAEANDANHLQALEDSLRAIGYVRYSPRTFTRYNFLFR